MPITWVKALNAYLYHADLRKYGRASQFPEFFNREIAGDRNSTVAFRNSLSANGTREHGEIF